MNALSRRGPLVAVLLLIGLATLVPLGGAPPRFFRGFDWSDLLVNICLYLPLGLLLGREKLSPLAVAAIAVGLAGAIELLQGTVIPGRRGSPVDVAANFLGAMAGLACYGALLRAGQLRTRSMIAGATVLALLPVAGWVASGPLLAPRPPETRRWWGQWAHHFAGTEPFPGTIVAVRLMGHEVPDDQLDSTATLLALARRGPLRLEVTLLSGGTTDGHTHIAGVSDGEGHVIIALEQQGDDLLLAWRSRGEALGFRGPSVGFPGMLRGAAGEQLTIEATVSGSAARVRVGREDGKTEGRKDGKTEGDEMVEVRWLTPFTGWRNLIPTRDLSPSAQRLFDVVWTLGLVAYLLIAVRALTVRGER
jgi:VanZ family protein